MRLSDRKKEQSDCEHLKTLLIWSGSLEASTGALTVIVPTLIVGVLLDAPPDRMSTVLGRFFGAGILSLGSAALLARNHVTSPAGLGVAYALTWYNVLAAVLLIWTVSIVGLGGLILWLAALGHAVMGLLFTKALVTLRKKS